MVKAAIDRLEKHFGDALELANKATKSDLVGEDCQCLQFRGTINSVPWYGEAYLLAHHGFAYTLFCATSAPWGKEGDAAQVKTELERSKSFALVTDRRGWREQPPKLETFHAQSAPISINLPAGGVGKRVPPRMRRKPASCSCSVDFCVRRTIARTHRS